MFGVAADLLDVSDREADDALPIGSHRASSLVRVFRSVTIHIA